MTGLVGVEDHGKSGSKPPHSKGLGMAGVREGMMAGWPDLFAICEASGGGTLVSVNPPEGWGGLGGVKAGKGGCWEGLGLPSEVLDALGRLHGKVVGTGEIAVEDVAVRPSGAVEEERVVECRLAAMREKGSTRVGMVVVSLRDMTATRRAAEALKESERSYRLLAVNSSDMISLHDPSGNYLYASPSCFATIGRKPEEMVGRSAYDFIHPDDLVEVHRVHSAMLASSEDVFTLAFRLQREDGSYVWLETTTRTVREAETGAVVEIQCASRDITRRKQVEQELRESRELLQAVLDNSPAVVYIKDREGRYLLINQRFELLFQVARRSIIGLKDSEIFPRDLAEAFRENDLRVFESGKSLEIEEKAPHEDGIHTYVSVKFPLFDREGTVYALCGISTDITLRHRAEVALRGQSELLRLQNLRLQEAAAGERQAHEALKAAEVQLVQAEKLTSLGQMVAGVAHEINNPLSFVINNVAVLQRDVEGLRRILRLYHEGDQVLEAGAPELHAKVLEAMEEIDLGYTLENLERLTSRSREGLRRIQQIVKDLRDFARLDEGDIQEVDLNVGVTSTLNIIQGKAATNRVSLAADLNPIPKVACYPGKINQVIMNLLANAIDACEPEGKVTVRTEPAAGALGVLIHIIDNGSGIAAAVMDRIFDPFFTTKPVGQGTGLGLSISYGIVKAHGGTISVSSQPGAGSRFTVWLPLSPQLAALPAPAEGSSGEGDEDAPPAR